MEKNNNVRVLGFPKKTYALTTLERVNDKKKSEIALADGDTYIYQIDEFQTLINENSVESAKALMDYYWFFINW